MVHTSPFIRRLADLLPSPGLINPMLEGIGVKSAGIEKGAEILTMGPTGRQIAAVSQGIAMRYRILPDGSRQVIMFLMPGDLCSPHIYPTVIDHNVAAVTPVRIDRFECESLISMATTIVGLNQALWTLAEQQNAIMRDHITSLGRADTRMRVATLLVEMVRRLAPKGEPGPVMIPVTQSLLADAIGVTHIHFNRVVSDFARRGVLDTCRGGILVNDLCWLTGVADEMTEAA
jgi:CRP/FNR family transcriptional regulator, anaerobic regulatory protein